MSELWTNYITELNGMLTSTALANFLAFMTLWVGGCCLIGLIACGIPALGEALIKLTKERND